MEKDYIVKLTLALYRVTELFPDKEPLKFFLRKKANEIMADFVAKGEKSEFSEKILKNLEILQDYFKIAENQKWVSQKNFFVLKREYNKIVREIKRPKSAKKGKSRRKTPLIEEDCEYGRREKILEVLKQRGKAQTGEFLKFFPEVTKRTLRRDFQCLLDKRLVKRIGSRNRTFYKLYN